MTSRLGLVGLFVLVTSCGSPPPQETTPAPPEEAQAVEPEIAAPSEPTPAPAPPPGPAPTLSLSGAPRTLGRHVAISIVNRGGAPAEVSSTLAIEVERNGAFVAEGQTLRLRYDCATEPPACVTLAPGAELIPPEWLGTWGDVQCVCTRCGPAEAGTYRLVATTCDGAHRVEGAPFVLGPP